jgi:alanyl-tRNA synthetase
MTFLVADGVTPSNEGRGYVLRRVIRRAVLHGRDLGLESFLPRLSGVVVGQMSSVYPEVREKEAIIGELLAAEEERFSRTLALGERYFDEAAADGAISGEEAFKLHDTYGYPIELTRERARERGLAVDEAEFERLMAEQRERSRAAAAFDIEIKVAGEQPTEFVGYEKTEVLTALMAGAELEDGLFQAKLFESPFYPEGGGQVSDVGWIEKLDGSARAELVKATRIGDDQVLIFRGQGFKAGDRVKAVVPWRVRFPTMANHTATHLLHKALQEVLGDHVRQAGSAVRPDKLRFDFTHSQALTPEERQRVEEIVNERIFEGLPVHAFLTPIDEARRLGAMMLFGEKYGDVVRVVEIPDFSRELCGGTHVRSTAEIGPFVILSEGSVGSGVRRIEAFSSGEAYAYLRAQAAERQELERELERARKEQKAPAREPETVVSAEREQEINGVRVYVAELANADAEVLLEVSDREKQKRSPAAVVLGSREDGRVHLVANFDKAVADRGLSAVEVVRAAAALVGGGGGGRPTMARAGGRDPEKLPAALAHAEQAIVQALT